MSFDEYAKFNKYIDIAEYLIDECSVYLPCQSRAPQMTKQAGVLPENTRMLKVFYGFKEHMFKIITDDELDVLGVSRQQFKVCQQEASLSKDQLRYLFTTKRFMSFVYHTQIRLDNRKKKKDIYPAWDFEIDLEKLFKFCGILAKRREDFKKEVHERMENKYLGKTQRLTYEIKKKSATTINNLNDVIDTISEYWYGSNIDDTFKDIDKYTSLKDLSIKFNNIAANAGENEWNYILKELNNLKNGKENLLEIYTQPFINNDKFYQYLQSKDQTNL